MPSDKVTSKPWTLETYRQRYDRLLDLAEEREADRPQRNVGRYILGWLADLNDVKTEGNFGMTVDGVRFEFVVTRCPDSTEPTDAE